MNVSSGRLKFEYEEYTLLADIIKEAYLNCYKEYDDIPSIDINLFREILKSKHSVSFPATENGDALLFMIFLNYFLKDIEDADPEIKKVTSNMQIKFLATHHGEASVMYCSEEIINFFRFPAFKVIPLIEEKLSQDEDLDRVSQFKDKCKAKFAEFMAFALRNNKEDEMYSRVCKIIDNEKIEYDIELNIVEPYPRIICFVFEYKCIV